MKPWDEYRGDELNVNGLKRGPEYLPILHMALDWFQYIRNEQIKRKLKTGDGSSFFELYPLIRRHKEIEVDVGTYYEQLMPALEILKQGNYILFAHPNNMPVIVPLVTLTEQAINHLTYDKDFREHTRDRLMFYLFCGAKIG